VNIGEYNSEYNNLIGEYNSLIVVKFDQSTSRICYVHLCKNTKMLYLPTGEYNKTKISKMAASRFV
jgi:hypothetical protein